MTVAEMKAAIIEELTDELSVDESFDATVLENKVNSAIQSVQRIRRYPASYTDDMIENDLVSYYDVILKVALARYNRVGADDEASHSENGINRTFVREERLFNGVLPICAL